MVDGLRRAWLTLGSGVTFLVGENGLGKSTLVEAVAVALGLNPEGGSRSFRFATRAGESTLGVALRLGRAPGRERGSYFLRAESYYNVATEIERLDEIDPPLLPAYGGVSPHERSHGESFLDLLVDLVQQRSQFLVATHSPILLAVPDARILQIADDGTIAPVRYDDALPVHRMRRFLADPAATVRDLIR